MTTLDRIGVRLRRGRKILEDQHRQATKQDEDSKLDLAESLRRDSVKWARRWRQAFAEADTDKELQEAVNEAYAELDELETRVAASFRLRLVHQLQIAAQRDLDGYTPWGGQDLLLQILQSAVSEAAFATEEEEFLEAIAKTLESSKLSDTDVDRLIEHYGETLAEYLARYLNYNVQSA